jgi:arylsulfatase A-like enzyme
VLILADDLGYGDLGCYGSETLRTPNIDRLAAEGQRWTSFYSSASTCAPSRRGLMTGRHPALLEEGEMVEARPQFMSSMLRRAGYATALLGKWHLAGYRSYFVSGPLHPLDSGFDHYFGTPGSNDVPKPEGTSWNRELYDGSEKDTFLVPLIRGRNTVEIPANQELFTRRYTEEAVAWIRQNRDRPFFLLISHNMPHAPPFASREFQGRSAGGRYGDAVEEIDWSVGQVMAALREAGIDETTLVVFTSDNGPWSQFGDHGGSAGPFRGEKGTGWEGGHRVPAIFRWPGRIEPAEIDGMAVGLDLHATFATLAGAEPPAEPPAYRSVDLSGSLLRGEPSPRTAWLYAGHGLAFRSGRYKIHRRSRDRFSDPETGQSEPLRKHDPPLLFDLLVDPGERTNIAAEHPEIVERLWGEMKAFRGDPAEMSRNGPGEHGATRAGTGLPSEPDRAARPGLTP